MEIRRGTRINIQQPHNRICFDGFLPNLVLVKNSSFPRNVTFFGQWWIHCSAVFIFSKSFILHMSRRLKRPLCPSVRRSPCPSVRHYITFEQTLTKLDRRLLPSLCFSSRSVSKDSHWSWYVFDFSERNVKKNGKQYTTFSSGFVFFGSTRQQRWPACLWFAEAFSTIPLQLQNGIWRNWTEAIDVLFQENPSTKMTVRVSDIQIFSTSPGQLLNRIRKKHDSKQILDIIYQVCVFHADLSAKVAVLASDCLAHFGRWINTRRWINIRILTFLQIPNLIYCCHSVWNTVRLSHCWFAYNFDIWHVCS